MMLSEDFRNISLQKLFSHPRAVQNSVTFFCTPCEEMFSTMLTDSFFGIQVHDDHRLSMCKVFFWSSPFVFQFGMKWLKWFFFSFLGWIINTKHYLASLVPLLPMCFHVRYFRYHLGVDSSKFKTSHYYIKSHYPSDTKDTFCAAFVWVPMIKSVIFLHRRIGLHFH